MRETLTSGTVGGAPGNRCFYPEIRSFTVVELEFTSVIKIYTCESQ